MLDTTLLLITRSGTLANGKAPLSGTSSEDLHLDCQTSADKTTEQRRQPDVAASNTSVGQTWRISDLVEFLLHNPEVG